MKSWNDDITKILLYAGLENKNIGLMFSDCLMIDER